ncbi:hypothetical protein F5Y19DRAFT_431483 [Xylariaceae sp. FL1651]|nr:hypothetical protein F5Y19DRAFT_431483 [Xylariaceae sp. FL1651]
MLEQLSIEEMFDQAKPNVTEEEAKAIKLLIRWILQYDPAKRPSAAEINLSIPCIVYNHCGRFIIQRRTFTRNI